MKKIIILRGNSGSGKTTVARALQKKFGYNTMMISQDEIRRNILWVKDGVDTKALPLMIELMKYGYAFNWVNQLPVYVLAGMCVAVLILCRYLDISRVKADIDEINVLCENRL